MNLHRPPPFESRLGCSSSYRRLIGRKLRSAYSRYQLLRAPPLHYFEVDSDQMAYATAISLESWGCLGTIAPRLRTLTHDAVSETLPSSFMSSTTSLDWPNWPQTRNHFPQSLRLNFYDRLQKLTDRNYSEITARCHQRRLPNFYFSSAFAKTIITTISHLPLHSQFLRRGPPLELIRRAANLWLGTSYPPPSQNLCYGSRSPFLWSIKSLPLPKEFF